MHSNVTDAHKDSWEPEAEAAAPRKTAVLIPCYNEELTIGDVVQQFRQELPHAAIYVYDNNSSDRTVERAKAAGATVCFEPRQGKGYVIQSMFRQIEADVYVLVDGDGTYPPGAVHRLIAPVLRNEADMVIGSRLHLESESKFKAVNRFGNGLFVGALNSLFGVRLSDLLSGYRAFNRSFVKWLPLVGGGFEIETELTIKALERGYRVVEIPVDLSPRPTGSFSKIRVFSDGVMIFNTIFALARDYKPLTVFGGVGVLLILGGLAMSLAVALQSPAATPPTIPPAMVAGGLLLSGMLSTTVGLILHTVVRRFQDVEYQLRILGDTLIAAKSPDGQARRSGTQA